MGAWELACELAGETGAAPLDHSLRTLYWMARGRRWAEWNHTANIIAHIRGVFDGKIDPRRWHPYLNGPPAAVKSGGMAALKTLVLSGGLK